GSALHAPALDRGAWHRRVRQLDPRKRAARGEAPDGGRPGHRPRRAERRLRGAFQGGARRAPRAGGPGRERLGRSAPPGHHRLRAGRGSLGPVNVSVVGAGAWGTAIACHAARRHPVHLWARDPAQARAMDEQRENARYLPGVRFPEGLAVGSDLDAALAACADGLLLVGTTVAGLGPVLADIAGRRAGPRPAAMLWLCKGIEPGSERLPHQVVRASGVDIPGGVLSGPSFAQEVAAGLPVALVAAAPDAAVREA